MLKFALQRQGQNCQICTRGRARACRGSLPVLQLKKHNRFDYHRPELNVQPSSHRRRGLLPTLNDRVCTLGVGR
jgi:hypothetical protein